MVLDGPDEVHIRTVAKFEISNQQKKLASREDREFALLSKRMSDLKGLSNEEMLELYALYKQATVGDCNTSKIVDGTLFDNGLEKPTFSSTGAAKWTYWNKLKGLPQNKAKQFYIERMKSLLSSTRSKL